MEKRVRRPSVMMDLNTRVKMLAELSSSLDNPNDGLVMYTKHTLVDFLQMTRLIVSKNGKVGVIRTELEKVISVRAASNQGGASGMDIFSGDMNVITEQDQYMRIVGSFSVLMASEELMHRIKSLPDKIRMETQILVRCVCEFVKEFFMAPGVSRNGRTKAESEYVRCVEDFDPDVLLLIFVDNSKLLSELQAFTSSDITKLLTILDSNLPKISSEAVASKQSKLSTFKRLIGSSEKQSSNKASDVSTLLQRHLSMVQELRLDRFTEIVMQHLPPSTQLQRLLKPKVASVFANLGVYVQEADRLERLRATMDSISRLSTTLIKAETIVAAFRTLLFSKELQLLKPDWTLLDMPEKAIDPDSLSPANNRAMTMIQE